MRWDKVRVQGGGVGPGKRWGHTCNAIGGGKLLYVFGGYGKDDCQTNQVHVLDTVNRIWSEPVMKGAVPIPRDSHSCTTVGDNLFVFGGTDGRRPLGDLHILDTSCNTWMSPSLRGDGPEPREGHSAALIGRRLFIFGGCGKSEGSEIYYDDLYVLNTETFTWKRVVPSGTPPTKRESHSCSSWRNKIIVIGGEDTCNFYLSDVYILDTDAGVWNKIMATGEGPSARFSMAGECLDPHLGGAIVFLGGCNKKLEALDDMYYLHTGFVGESERDDRRIEKLSLRKQLKLKCQEQQASLTEGRQNVHLHEYQNTPGKKTFQAKVTKSFPDGYTIETVIDGKPLRGVLFSNKPKSVKWPSDDSDGKGEAMETDGNNLNNDPNSTSENARPTPTEQNVKDVRQADALGGELTMSVSQTGDATAGMRNPPTTDASLSQEV
nr:kelch domain-containing protein 3-like [Ipomoea batatas]